MFTLDFVFYKHARPQVCVSVGDANWRVSTLREASAGAGSVLRCSTTGQRPTGLDHRHLELEGARGPARTVA